MWFLLMYISRNQTLKRHFLRLSGTEIDIGMGVCAFNIILKIRCRYVFLYLAIIGAFERVFRAGIEWSNKTEALKSLLKSPKRVFRKCETWWNQGKITTINHTRVFANFKSYFKKLNIKIEFEIIYYPNELARLLRLKNS